MSGVSFEKTSGFYHDGAWIHRYVCSSCRGSFMLFDKDTPDFCPLCGVEQC